MSLLTTNPNARKAALDEFLMRSANDGQLRDGSSLGNLPLVVLGASRSLDDLAHWREAQEAQAALSMQGRLIVVQESGHYIHWEHPDAVIDAIQSVILTASGSSTGIR